MWKFNNSLLANEAFCQNIRSTIDVFSSFEHTFLSVVDFWEALKQDFKQISIEFSRNISRGRARDQVVLTNKLICLKATLVAGNSSVNSAIFHTETELNNIYLREMEGSKIRSRAQWLELGKAPSRYFFQLEHERFLNVQSIWFIMPMVLKCPHGRIFLSSCRFFLMPFLA